MPAASHPSPVRIVRASDLLDQPWRNGAGSTRQIACQPAGDGQGWGWRLSLARIETEAPFSRFPGVEREQLLVHGDGVCLRFDDGRVHELLPPHGRARFAGEDAVDGAPLTGPASVLNLMWRRDGWDAQLWLRPMVGTLALFADPGETWALHLVAGQVALEDGASARLGAGDTLLAEGRGRRTHLRLQGHGEAVLARLRPADRQPIRSPD